MAASNPGCVQQGHDAATLLDQARQMILPGKDSIPISDWLDVAAEIVEVVHIFAGALAGGVTSSEAWDDAGSDADEFGKAVKFLDAPDFLSEVNGDSENISELSDLSRRVLQNYADRLGAALSSLHRLLLSLSESFEYDADLADAVQYRVEAVVRAVKMP